MEKEPTKDDILQIQKKIILNIIRHCENNNITINDILTNCNLSEERIKEILDLKINKAITLSELYMLSKAVNIEFSEIFKI